MIFCIRLIACSKLLQGPHGQKGRMWAIVETMKIQAQAVKTGENFKSNPPGRPITFTQADPVITI